MDYRKTITNIQNSVDYREDIEWSNFWYDNANNHQKGCNKRYLLIGDSTVRMIRASLAGITQCPVDMLGTSSALDDELFVNQIDAFFANSKYFYDAVFVQLGHHGRISHKGGDYGDDDFDIFKENYILLIEYLKQYSSQIIVETIFDSVIPKRGVFNMLMKKLHLIKEMEDKAINRCTKKKNEILRNLNIYTGGVMFCDINKIIKQYRFSHIDHIHFENKAKVVIAQIMAGLL